VTGPSGSGKTTTLAALRAALREDPDILMIGEMRDLQTMSLAVSAAETGHLVSGTLPTGSAVRTISAVLDYFPPDQQGQVRSMISGRSGGFSRSTSSPGRTARAWRWRSRSSSWTRRSPP
jgi:Tfp pilus assembly pilus retraction ATPase PilT